MFTRDMSETHIQEPHTHECRRCGADIFCTGDGENCWGGDNDGCPDAAAENEAEAIEFDLAAKAEAAAERHLESRWS